ncbi:MAG: hypothetical protein ACLQVY_19265 [Limisphaerales bacterium]
MNHKPPHYCQTNSNAVPQLKARTKSKQTRLRTKIFQARQIRVTGHVEVRFAVPLYQFANRFYRSTAG